MVLKKFKEEELKKLYKPREDSTKEDNGKIVIIGGSSLFHGAPISSLKVASRIVDMVFFASPEPSVGRVAEKIKSKLNSFIWVPFDEVEEYIKKSDAVLIGPGLMRYHKKIPSSKSQISNKLDETGRKSKEITETLLKKFSEKQWVIDAGSLQVMEAKFIPKNAILTPNRRELEILFRAELGNRAQQVFQRKRPSAPPSAELGIRPELDNSESRENIASAATSPHHLLQKLALKHNCIIVLKDVDTFVCSPDKCVVIKGGNAGLTKGGTGDVLAGLAVALAAKNPPFLAACTAAYLTKKAAEELYKKVGFAYNADDLAEEVPWVLGRFWR